MIERANGAARVTTPLVMANARGLLDAGRSALVRGEETVFDLSGVRDADSSALAFMLGLLRSAKDMNASVRFVQVPVGVRALAELYGLAEFLPFA